MLSNISLIALFKIIVLLFREPELRRGFFVLLLDVWRYKNRKAPPPTALDVFEYKGPLIDEPYMDKYPVGGIDVSKWQGSMNFETAISRNTSFAFIRASYAWYTADEEYARNIANARMLLLPCAPYHFLTPTTDINDAVVEAHYFMEQLSLFGKGNIYEDGKPIVVLDLETRGELGAKSQQLFDYIWKWIDTVEKGGYAVLIYSSGGWMGGNLRSEDIRWLSDNYDYWHAQYTQAEEPSLPAGMAEWSFWQFSADGNGLGYEYGASGSQSIDLNRYNGSWEEFMQKYLPDQNPPDPEPEPEPEPEEPEIEWTISISVKSKEEPEIDLSSETPE